MRRLNLSTSTSIIILLVIAAASIIASATLYPAPRQNTVKIIYEAHVSFRNYHVGSIILDGDVDGLLEARYRFYHETVIVDTHYLKYRLKGFTSPEARVFIEKLIGESVRRVYDISNYTPSDIPYPRHSLFIRRGGLPYYINPILLSDEPIYRQRIAFTLSSGKELYNVLEDRVFKYDKGSGVLTETRIESRITSNTTGNQIYLLELHSVSADNPEAVLETGEAVYYAASVALASAAAALIYGLRRSWLRGLRQ